MNDLEREYQNIRKLFFPRWDREGLWKASSNPPEDGKGCFSLAGYCDPDNKIIHVMTDSEGYSLTLAHEICHAVTTQSHEKKWFQRMMKANVVADQLGNDQLATEIREDADMFAAAPRLSAAEVESRFCDAVIDAPGLDFENIVQGVATENGITSEELLQRWPTAPKRGFEQGKIRLAQIMGLTKPTR